jgi:putative DNA primase/helicase
MTLPSIATIAKVLGGDINGADGVTAPGPGHSAADRSMSVTLDANAPEGFLVHSFSGDDDIVCKDYVRDKLGLPKWSANGKDHGRVKAYNPIAKHIYRLADGTAYLRVDRFADKQRGFPQFYWDTKSQWLKGKPKGPKVPYRLPELLAAPLETQVHVCEGEKDADNLAKLGFVATCNSEGAETGTGKKFTSDLFPYFKDRDVYVHEDNDDKGRKHVQCVARMLHGVAASIRIVRLPGLKKKGDVSDFLKGDPSGVRFIQECERSPLWEPGASDEDHDTAASDNDPDNEDGMALAFAEQEQSNLRYIAENGRWLIWSATHWRIDNILAAYRTARKLCRKYGARKQKTVAAVVTLAKSDIRLVATTEQFDINPWLLNAENGTIDLRTGIERPAEPLDYITKKTGCVIAPKGTPHPLWTEFLNRVMGLDPKMMGSEFDATKKAAADVISFLQRYIGYCLTGLTIEHRFVFGHGTGANGKGTFLNTIVKVFGDYATTATMETFIASQHERHPTDIAKLVGSRLVVAQETQQGRKWDEEKIKALTGGDRQSARFMRQDFFDFEPTFKLFITGNHKPNLNTVDEAMRRRFLLVPFTVTIPEAERDVELAEKLVAEWPAILRWAVDGCLEWQRVGLAPPKTVLEATKEYFEAEDSITQWIEQECDSEPNNEHKWAPVADLFAKWAAFAKAGGDNAGSKKSFSEAMQARGYERGEKGHAKQRVFTGIRLNPPPKSPNEKGED